LAIRIDISLGQPETAPAKTDPDQCPPRLTGVFSGRKTELADISFNVRSIRHINPSPTNILPHIFDNGEIRRIYWRRKLYAVFVVWDPILEG
jgi:hypothetical protein